MRATSRMRRSSSSSPSRGTRTSSRRWRGPWTPSTSPSSLCAPRVGASRSDFVRRRASRACQPEPGSDTARRRSRASRSALRVWWDRLQLMPWDSCTRRALAWLLMRGRSWRGGSGNMPDSLLRAGTCNVRTLSGRMGAVMDMATEAGIHILCLQETKLTSEGIHALRQAFQHRGRFLPGELHFDQQGKASDGVAIVADWPVELVDCPLAASFPGRIMAVKALAGRDNDHCWSSTAIPPCQ